MANVKVALGWEFTNDPTGPADEFRLKRRDVNTGVMSSLSAVPWVSGQTVYTTDDATVIYGARYVYTVAAHNQGGDTGVDVGVSVVIPPPPGPTNVTAKVVQA